MGKFLISKSFIKSKTSLFAILGLTLGSACMVASMSVISGFEETLKSTIVHVSGDIILLKQEDFKDSWEELEEEVKAICEPYFQSSMPFFIREGVSTRKGKLAAVLLYGIHAQKRNDVLNLDSRLLEGKMNLTPNTYPTSKNKNKNKDKRNETVTPLPVFIGKTFAHKMQLSLGDTLNVVFLPEGRSHKKKKQSLTRKNISLEVRAILDLGLQYYDERYIFADKNQMQKALNLKGTYNGLIVKLSHSDKAAYLKKKLEEDLGFGYWIQDWQQSNRNLFSAVKIEKVMIFFVLLVMIFAAAFNVAGTLFLHTRQRYKDIAILKTLGISSIEILLVFIAQGLLLGILGLILGFALGALLCVAFVFAQSHWQLIPGDIYRLNFILPTLSGLDILAIVIGTLAICFVFSLLPSWKGSQTSKPSKDYAMNEDDMINKGPLNTNLSSDSGSSSNSSSNSNLKTKEKYGEYNEYHKEDNTETNP